MTTRYEWTEAKDTLLVNMWHSDKSVRAITEAMGEGATQMIVRHRARVLGLPLRDQRPQWTPERVEQARALRAQGLRLEDIAKIMRASKDTISVKTRGPKEEPPHVKPRTCLKCGDTFPSHGPGHRLCDKCRRYASDHSHLWGKSL